MKTFGERLENRLKRNQNNQALVLAALRAADRPNKRRIGNMASASHAVTHKAAKKKKDHGTISRH